MPENTPRTTIPYRQSVSLSSIHIPLCLFSFSLTISTSNFLTLSFSLYEAGHHLAALSISINPSIYLAPLFLSIPLYLSNIFLYLSVSLSLSPPISFAISFSDDVAHFLYLVKLFVLLSL